MTAADVLMSLGFVVALLLVAAALNWAYDVARRLVRRYLVRRDLRKMFGGEWP